MSKGYHDPLVRKQISVFLPAEDWRVLRDEAARQRVPMTELCRRWLRPGIDELQSTRTSPATTDPRRSIEESASRSCSF